MARPFAVGTFTVGDIGCPAQQADLIEQAHYGAIHRYDEKVIENDESVDGPHIVEEEAAKEAWLATIDEYRDALDHDLDPCYREKITSEVDFAIEVADRLGWIDSDEPAREAPRATALD